MIRTTRVALTIAWCIICGSLGSETNVSAQVATSFQKLPKLLKEGDRLLITDRYAIVMEGRFVKTAVESLRITAKSGQLVDFPEGSVTKIEKLRTRTGKFAGIGFLVGFAGGILFVATAPDPGPFVATKKSVILPVAAI